MAWPPPAPPNESIGPSSFFLAGLRSGLRRFDSLGGGGARGGASHTHWEKSKKYHLQLRSFDRKRPPDFCPSIIKNEVVFFDKNHLNLKSAASLAPLAARVWG